MNEPTRARDAWIALAAIFALALTMRFAFWSEVRGTALDRWHLFDQTDMATYLEQARQFAGGDWLAREPYHPYHGWQAVAPPERWLAWYGPHAFHQAPAYAFAIAVADLALGDPIPWIKAAQLALGSGTALLAFALTRALAGFAAGCIAGVLVAVYGPLFYLEAQLLREGPALFAVFAFLWLLTRALRRSASPTRLVDRQALVIGACVGAFHMLHEMGTVLLAVALVALAAHAWTRAGAKRAALAAAMVLVGYAIGFAPLFARNVAVGASPFSVSCRTVINFVQANEADAPDGGSTFSPPGPNVVRILDQARGSTLRAFAGVWSTYRGDYDRALSNAWLRFAAIWKWPEEADNTSYDFHREQTATLRWLPTFSTLFPLGVAGTVLVFVVGALGARSGKTHAPAAAWRERRSAHLGLLLFVCAVAASLSLVHTVARFRLYVTPFFFVYAAIAIHAIVASARSRQVGVALIGAGSIAAAVVFQRSITRETERDLFRFVDYGIAARHSVQAGEPEAARAFAERGVREHFGEPSLFIALGIEFEGVGDFARAAEAYRSALTVSPGDPNARQGLQRALARSGGGSQ